MADSIHEPWSDPGPGDEFDDAGRSSVAGDSYESGGDREGHGTGIGDGDDCGSGRESLDLLARMTTGAGNCPGDVRALVETLVAATETPVTGDLITGAGLADRVTVLARLVAALEAEAGRALAVADQNSLLPHAPVTHLQRQAGWTGRAASALTVASRFAARQRDLAQLWQTGQVSTEVVAAIARGLRGVTAEVEAKFLAAVVAQLPVLSLAGVKLLVAQTLDHLHPEDREAQEQTDWDRRCVSSTRHAEMTMIHADLPTLEADALLAALNAIAESLRVAGDRLTVGQRRADALITLVNRAAAQGDVPATRNGLPVATTVTIGLAEADRVASQTPRDHGGTRGGADLATVLTTPSVGTQAATLTPAHGTPVTLGDAAARFLVCATIARNPDPEGPHWRITPTPRHRWRTRR